MAEALESLIIAMEERVRERYPGWVNHSWMIRNSSIEACCLTPDGKRYFATIREALESAFSITTS